MTFIKIIMTICCIQWFYVNDLCIFYEKIFENILEKIWLIDDILKLWFKFEFSKWK